jgi:hypothetical protein
MAKFKIKPVPNITAYYWDGTAAGYALLPATCKNWCKFVIDSCIVCRVIDGTVFPIKTKDPCWIVYLGENLGCEFISVATMTSLYIEIV